MIKRLVCKIFGHKWGRRISFEPQININIVGVKESFYCLRCDYHTHKANLLPSFLKITY